MTTDVYTHGHHESVLRSHSWRTAANSAAHLLPHLREGQRLLDVGCGPGTITVDLAAHVAPGQVIGVDTSAEVLERARRHAAELGAPVSFQVGDAYALDFPDASFDVVHAHQVLEHLVGVHDVEARVREVQRVRVAHLEGDRGAQLGGMAPSTLQHLGRGVDTDHLPGRDVRREVDRDGARAASDVQQPLTLTQLRQQ